MKVNSAYVVTALSLASAVLVFANPNHAGGVQSHENHGQHNHGLAASGHGNSDFGHRQGNPATRTTGSGNNAFGQQHAHGTPTEPQPSPSPAGGD